PTIFRDVTRLLLSYIDKQSGWTNGDREKMENFIKTFVPQFFCMEPHASGMEEEDEENLADNEDDGDESVNSYDSDGDSRGSKLPRNAHSQQDLLKDVLTKNVELAAQAQQQQTSRNKDDRGVAPMEEVTSTPVK